MAITNVALTDHIGYAPGQPTFVDVVTLDLDATYPAGGYPNFTATVEAIIGKGKQILHVGFNNTPGTTKVYPLYDIANDKLVMNDWAGAENVVVDLSGCVGLELVIFSK